MAVVRLVERVTSPFSGSRVDRAKGCVHGVLICGTSSANGRDYPVEVLRRDCAKYESRPVNCDHGREATVDRRIGWFTGVAPGPDGRPRGTLNLLKSHPLYERVMEAAERNPALFGFSHVAKCELNRGRNGRDVVEAIHEVESIDLVADPATTKGMFESTRRRAVATTLRAVIESRRGKLPADRQASVRKLLLLSEEEGDMAAMMDTPVDVPDDGGGATDADGAIDDAFKQAMHAQIDAFMEESHTLAELISKIRELGKAHGKVTGKAAVAGDAEPDEPAEESRKDRAQSGRVLEALEACEAAGFRPDRTDLELVAATPADRRTKVIERLRLTGGEKPSSAGRHQTGRFAEEREAAGRATEGRNGKRAEQPMTWQD